MVLVSDMAYYCSPECAHNRATSLFTYSSASRRLVGFALPHEGSGPPTSTIDNTMTIVRNTWGLPAPPRTLYATQAALTITMTIPQMLDQLLTAFFCLYGCQANSRE